MLDQTLFLECMCYSDEHTLKWWLDADPDWPQVYVSVFLESYPNVFKRMWVAIRYVFGYKCRFGHWDSFMLRPEDIGRMQALLEAYQKAWHDSVENDKRRAAEENVAQDHKAK